MSLRLLLLRSEVGRDQIEFCKPLMLALSTRADEESAARSGVCIEQQTESNDFDIARWAVDVK